MPTLQSETRAGEGIGAIIGTMLAKSGSENYMGFYSKQPLLSQLPQTPQTTQTHNQE